PETHVKEFLGCNFIALICNKDSAIFCSTSFNLFMAQIYKIYMNQSLLIMADCVPKGLKNPQTIGKQDIDVKKLFNKSCKTSQKKVYLMVDKDVKNIFENIISKIKVIKA